jgi:hypothetical protein
MPDTMVDLAERSGQLCSGLDHFPSLPYTNKHIDSCAYMANYVAKAGEERRREELISSGAEKRGSTANT